MREQKKTLKHEDDIVKALKGKSLTLKELTDALLTEDTKSKHREYMNEMNKIRGTLKRLVIRKRLKARMENAERGDFEKKTLYEVAV